MNHLALANAIAAMKPEWSIGEESKAAWKQFVEGFQSGRLLVSETGRSTVAPNVDGQDFYELCQAYRHSKEIMPYGMRNTVQAFNDLRYYIKTGALPWPSYERSSGNEESK